MQLVQNCHTRMNVAKVDNTVAVPVEVCARRKSVAGIDKRARNVEGHATGTAGGYGDRRQNCFNAGYIQCTDSNSAIGCIVGIDVAAVLDTGFDRIAGDVGRRHGA